MASVRMSMGTTMKYPKWVTEAPKKKQASVKLLYHFRLAALQDNPKASLVAVTDKIGYSREAVHMCIRRGYVSRGIAACMEKHFDQDVFPTIIMAREGLIK